MNNLNIKLASIRMVLGAIHKGLPADPKGGGLRNLDVQLLFECYFIVLSGRKVLAGRPL